MPNDAVLGPTVHHLLAEDRFNRGEKSGRFNKENPATQGHCTTSLAHDLVRGLHESLAKKNRTQKQSKSQERKTEK